MNLIWWFVEVWRMDEWEETGEEEEEWRRAEGAGGGYIGEHAR
jgi:hypothetical protein